VCVFVDFSIYGGQKVLRVGSRHVEAMLNNVVINVELASILVIRD